MKLQIGCLGERIEGFNGVDIVQHGGVEYVRDAKDLSCFKDGEIEEIYASHILEHFHKPETLKVLEEWHRVLQKGGTLHLSVPDFEAVVDMYIKSGWILSTWLDHLMHGDQADPQSFHYTCFTYPTLSGMLSKVGFSRIQRVEQLPYNLDDASKITDNRFNRAISVNIKAVK